VAAPLPSSMDHDEFLVPMLFRSLSVFRRSMPSDAELVCDRLSSGNRQGFGIVRALTRLDDAKCETLVCTHFEPPDPPEYADTVGQGSQRFDAPLCRS